MPHVAERAPAGWKIQHEKQTGNHEPGVFGPNEDADFSDDSPDARAYRKAWARLLSKVYEIDPLVCPRMHGRAMSIANDQPQVRIGNESDSGNSGARRNRSHSQASCKTGTTSPGVDPASLY